MVARVGRERLGRVFPDESDDHAVEVEEEHDQMETKLEEGLLCRLLEKLRSNDGHVAAPYLLVDVELAEDLGRVEKVSVVDDPRTRGQLCPTRTGVMRRG